MPADRERGGVVMRIRGDGAERGAQSGPEIHRPREDWPLSPWPFLGGALAGGSAAILGAARAPCAPVGQMPGAFTTDAAFSVACPCPARSGRGGGGSVWDGYCVEFDFSRPAPGKLASLGTARIIYRELANQTQQSNLTFPSPRKFLQLGVTRRQTNLLVVPNFPPACVASETITPYEIS